MEAQTLKKDPPSPAQSNLSSDSEGRDVREKLKETGIDAHGTSDPPLKSDEAMKDAPTNGTGSDHSTFGSPLKPDQAMKDASTNGTDTDHSASGSDSERGRLRRKRSLEDFEDDEGKQPEKKQERHVRKKSRETAPTKEVEVEATPKEKQVETIAKPANTATPLVEQKHNDEPMHSQEKGSNQAMQAQEKDSDKAIQPQEPSAAHRQDTSEDDLPDKYRSGVASPKNKRTREQAEAGAETPEAPVAGSEKETISAAKFGDERTTKRPRDTSASRSATNDTASKNKVSLVNSASSPKLTSGQILPGSGFSNTSSISPFAAIPPKPQASNTKETSTKVVPQTSASAFQKSGFGSFAKSSSPFTAAPGSASPFGGTSDSRLSSFSSSTATTTIKPSGFAGIEKSSGQSAFGGSLTGKTSAFGTTAFGSSMTSGFAKIGGSSNKMTFGSGAGITGLEKAPTTLFGAKEGTARPAKEDGDEAGDDEDGDDEGDSDGEGEDQPESERRTSQALLQSQGPPETGEENEHTVWTGRAKLYTLVTNAGKKSWQERGTGAIKLNITREAPVKARFVLRADGTHRLLLNAAVTANMRFGSLEGGKPEDGKILFTAPTAAGEVESHLLKVSAVRPCFA
jgi:Ran-binding protein 3